MQTVRLLYEMKFRVNKRNEESRYRLGFELLEWFRQKDEEDWLEMEVDGARPVATPSKT